MGASVIYHHYAEDRNRTGTVKTYRGILSPSASASSATPACFNIAIKSGKRGSNPRPPPWQGGVLPLNYFRKNAG